MLSPSFPAASWFLYGLSLVVALAVAGPLVFMPLRWARAVGWRVPEDTDLVVYLARCLGGVVFAVIALVLRAAPRPEAHVAVFHLVTWIAAIMTMVHLVGAIEERQPWFETLETAIYAGIAAASWGFAAALAA
jgi:hypothetical protein